MTVPCLEGDAAEWLTLARSRWSTALEDASGVLPMVGGADGFAEVCAGLLARTRAKCNRFALFPPVDIPWAVAAATGLGECETRAIAAACAIVWAAADVLDDLADGAPPDQWTAAAPAQVQIAATALITCGPQFALGELADCGVKPSRIAQAQQAVRDGLWQMAAGQWLDLDRDRPKGLARAAATNSLKTGSEFATFACLPALVAGRSRQQCLAWAKWGLALGKLSQFVDDFLEAVGTGDSPDLSLGKWTPPVAGALLVLPPDQAAELHRLLASGMVDNAARREAQDTLRDSRPLRFLAGWANVLARDADAALPVGVDGGLLAEARRVARFVWTPVPASVPSALSPSDGKVDATG